MSKFEMSRSQRRRESVMKVSKDQELIIQEKKNEDLPLSHKILTENNIKEGLNLLNTVVSGQYQIKTIRENSEARIQEINKEMEQQNTSTENELKIMSEKNSEWHSQFDKRQQALKDVIRALDEHPEYSDEIKKTLIEKALKD